MCASLCACLLPGCAPKYKGYGPHFLAIPAETRRVAVLQPDIYGFDVSEGGIEEYRVDWSRSAQEQLSSALKTKLLNKGFDTTGTPDSIDTQALAALKSFARFTTRAMQQHLYGENAFLPQIDTCDYSLGEISALCSLLQADAILTMYGIDERLSPERVRLLQTSANIKTARSAVFGILTAILVGTVAYRVYQVPPERTLVCCTIADRSGRIIFYNQYSMYDNADLRTPADARKVVEALLNRLNRSVR